MHPNTAFRRAPQQAALDLARRRGFGILSINGPDGPLLAHVPFLLDAGGGTLDLHLVRSNPVLRALPAPAVLAVSGPDGYVSPDWYGIADQVPTWNYVAVHLRGHLDALPQTAMRDMLDRQSASFERRLAGKPPWMPAKMTPDVLDRMLRQIVPCRLAVTAIDSTYKLGQNKPDAVRARAAAAIADGFGQDLDDLARLMREPPSDTPPSGTPHPHPQPKSEPSA